MRKKEIKMDKLRFKGIMLAILGTTFWGVSGTIANFYLNIISLQSGL